MNFYSALQVTLYSEALPTTAPTLCWSFHAEAHQAIESEGLAQGPYVVPWAGFEPTTLQLQANDRTNARHSESTLNKCPIQFFFLSHLYCI